MCWRALLTCTRLHPASDHRRRGPGPGERLNLVRRPAEPCLCRRHPNCKRREHNTVLCGRRNPLGPCCPRARPLCARVLMRPLFLCVCGDAAVECKRETRETTARLFRTHHATRNTTTMEAARRQARAVEEARGSGSLELSGQGIADLAFLDEFDLSEITCAGLPQGTAL
jgi:hypothetical protein